MSTSKPEPKPEEEIIGTAEKLIRTVNSFDEETPKETLVEKQKSVYSLLATLLQIDSPNPDIPKLIRELNKCNAHLYMLLGRNCVVNKICPSDIDFSTTRELGGGYGCVCSASYRGEPVAVKLLKSTSDEEDVERLKYFSMECGCLSEVKHENVMIMKGIITDVSSIHSEVGEKFIAGSVTELMATDLGKELKRDKLDMTQRFKRCIEAARGLYYLHDVEHIIHRDVKPENILVDCNGVAKIADFGFSQHLNNDRKAKDLKSVHGTAEYVAPEAWLGEVLTDKIDVFAFGVVLQQVFTDGGIHRLQLDSPDIFQSDKEDKKFGYYFDDGGRFDLEHLYSDVKESGMRKLIEDCWDTDPGKRPSMRKVYERLIECYIKSFTPHDLVVSSGFEDFSDMILKFWKSLSSSPGYPLKVVTEWFADELELPSCSEEMKYKIADFLSEGDFVTLEKFIRSVQWFGPWFLPQYSCCLEDLTDMLGKPCFRGFISREESTTILGGKPRFTFIVRGSKTALVEKKICPQLTPFTISFSFPEDDNKFNVMDVRVRRESFGNVLNRFSFYLGRETEEGHATNMIDIIQFMVTNYYKALGDLTFESAY